jgi:microcystin degradation protein MlrC
VEGTVRTVSDGEFVHKGPMSTGAKGHLGPTAVLDVDGIKVILNSYRVQTLDPEVFRSVGIEPTACKTLIVKSSIHYRAAFEPITSEIIEVDAPGLVSPDRGQFPYRKIKRPMFPLDEI